VKPSEASSLIRHLNDLDAKDLLTVLYMRVSMPEQRKRCNLKNRARALRRELRRRGIDWHASFTEVKTGTSLQDRPKLIEAIDAARTLQAENPNAHVAVVTDARNRFLRGQHYNGRASTDPPSAGQLRRLGALARGVVLATLRDPDASFGDVRSYETNIPTTLGEASGKKVGRPPEHPKEQRVSGWKKKRRERLLPEARRLHERGRSLRQIGRRFGVSFRTVANWLNREEKAS